MRKCWRCTPQSFRRFAFQTENVVGNLLSDFHGAVDGPQVTIADGGTKLTMEPPFNNDQKWVVTAKLDPVQCTHNAFDINSAHLASPFPQGQLRNGPPPRSPPLDGFVC